MSDEGDEMDGEGDEDFRAYTGGAEAFKLTKIKIEVNKKALIASLYQSGAPVTQSTFDADYGVDEDPMDGAQTTVEQQETSETLFGADEDATEVDEELQEGLTNMEEQMEETEPEPSGAPPPQFAPAQLVQFFTQLLPVANTQ